MTRSMFALAATLVLASCAASTPAPEIAPPSAAAPIPRADLSGTSWRLVDLNLDQEPVLPETLAHLLIESVPIP